MKKPIIGAHVSVAGGFSNGVLKARHLGVDSIQFFASSPRQWAVHPPAPKIAAEFKAAVKQAGLHSVFLHAPYLANLATPDVALWKKSIAHMTAQMKMAEMLGAVGVIFHTGSGESGMFRVHAMERSVAAIRQILRNSPGKAMLLIENAAGGGEKIGRDLAEIQQLIKESGSKRVGACFDTAHAYEAGIVRSYDRAGVDELAQSVEKTIGWDRLKAIHANDSKTEFDSRHDMHENIGKGHIGEAAFRELLANPKFRSIPFLLEVPGFDGNGPDKKNVDILRKLAG